jgi:2-dehydro-3-deoxygalactonokinase
VIGVEWGQNRFRAWRFGADGAVRDRRVSPRGLLSVPDFRFSDMLREELGRWIAGGEDRVLICGPATGGQGWRAARSVPRATPCGAAEIAAALTDVPFDWARVKLVPGIHHDDAETGISTATAAEAAHLLGAAAAIGGSGLLCMPGPASCWARLDGGVLVWLANFPTGESFAALRGALLGRIPRDAPLDGPGFARGLAQAARPGGLLRHLGGLRAEPASADAAALLFGLLVGHEIRAALGRRPGQEVHLLATGDAAPLHARAIAAGGGIALPPMADTIIPGLAAIGALADWT